MVKICCIGAGYVGGPTMAMIAFKCPDTEVVVVDIAVARINEWNSDRLPIFQPGLDDVVKACRGKNIFFSADVEKHVGEVDIVFVSVNTPDKTRDLGANKAADLTCWEKHVGEVDTVFVSVNTPDKTRDLGANKAADLTCWENAARMIVDVSNSDKIVVEKSTVPVKTAEAIEKILTHNNKGINFQILSNPEFQLVEETAIEDLMQPNRVLQKDGKLLKHGRLFMLIGCLKIKSLQ